MDTAVLTIDPDHLLGDELTLRELRLTHEAVAGKPLQRDNFRRAMEPCLIATGTTVVVGGGGRPNYSDDLVPRSDEDDAADR